MCLSMVSRLQSQPDDLIVDGWKNFSGTSSQPVFANFGNLVELDKWMKAAEVRTPIDIRANDGKHYRAGFHVYDDDARVKNVRRVYLRRVTCVGEQDGKTCVIAEEMFVPSDPNGWPPKPSAATAPAPPPPAPAPKPPAPKPSLRDRLRGKRGV